VGTLAALVGAVAAPTLASSWTRAGRRDALLVVLGAGIFVATSAAFVIGITRVREVALAATMIFYLFGSVGALLTPLIVQYVAPGRMRARLMAGYLMATNLVGMAVGPALTAWIGEHVFTGPFALASALAVVSGVFGPIATISILLARKRYVAAVDLAVEREAAALALAIA
jgi:MFS family permease